MDRPLTRVVTLACRTSDRLLDGTRGAVAVAPLVAEHLGVQTHTIGSSSAPKVQRWQDDLEESRGCLLEAGAQLDDALNGGFAPVLLAAECSIALSTLPTIARIRPDARFLWFDAHGDYNTPDTSPSGYLGGMPLAGACGEWDADLDVGFVDPLRVVHGGSRDLDEPERELLANAGVALVEGRAILGEDLTAALGDDPVYVHLDLDVLTEGELPVQFPTKGGIEIAELRELLTRVAAGREVIGFEVTNFQAPIDELEQLLGATAVLRVVEPLLDALKEGTNVRN
jgi:arginase family enzyme